MILVSMKTSKVSKTAKEYNARIAKLRAEKQLEPKYEDNPIEYECENTGKLAKILWWEDLLEKIRDTTERIPSSGTICEFFGTQDKAFSKEKLQSYVYAGELTYILTYLSTYFMKVMEASGENLYLM